jgi:hypothetical protein
MLELTLPFITACSVEIDLNFVKHHWALIVDLCIVLMCLSYVFIDITAMTDQTLNSTYHLII